MPTDLPRNRLGLAQVAAAAGAPADGPRDGQSLLAGGVRHRPRPHERATSASPASCRSHPELLDWLAVEFRESRLGREAVLQAARDVARPIASRRRRRPRSWRRTRDNRLLSRGPRFRMDAEMIRDYALAASGLLVPQDRRPEREAVPAGRRVGGGRDDRQQHPRLHAATPARTCTAAACTRSGSGPPRRRRWRSSTPRTARPAPSAASGPTRRSQALVTLNDPQFVEAARVLAEQALKAGGGRRRADRLRRAAAARPAVPRRGAGDREASRWRTCSRTTRRSRTRRRS